MKTLTIVSTALLGALMAGSLAGCAVTQATLDPNSERSVTRSFRDITAARAIKARMLRVEGFDLNDISVDVSQGIVVLAGAAPREEDKIEAERIAWSAPGVSQVGNEVRLGDSAGIFSKTKDDLISTSVRTKLAASNSVRNLNYEIETRDGVVYLMGVARNQEELAEAARLASITRGVKEVVSYATISGDIPNAYHSGGGSSVIADSRSSTIPYTPPAASSGEDLSYWGEPVGGDAHVDNTAPIPYIPNNTTELDPDALDSGEPIYRDPVTGERIYLPEGTEVLPYVPDAGPGSLGAGGAPLPPGAQPSKTLGIQSTQEFAGGTTVSLSDNYTLDEKGQKIPISWNGTEWVGLIK